MRDPSLNEETVKNRHLLPYLESLGLQPADLHFERSFRLRLGRQEGEPPVQGGRLDLLVRRGEKNLLVAEVKAAGLPVTDRDCDQAVSYARLLDQIAPLALVTNGTDHRLWDVVEKREIRREEVVPSRHFKVVLPPNLLALREEALSLFLGFSSENLLAFCRAQMTASIAALRGSPTDRNKKYIPELFVRRSDFSEKVASFLSSRSPLFVLVADAGLGKTCALCGTAENLIRNEVPVLFYRGVNLSDSPILQTIAEDFAWAFSEEGSARNLVRRLGDILGEQCMLVVLDGIDEWSNPQRRTDLIATARRLTGTNIKLLLSCKTPVWPEFAVCRGESTEITEAVFQGIPYRLTPLNNSEFREARERYSTFYGVAGAFENSALGAAQQCPFLFRILFEVAEQSGAEFLTFSSLEFFERYYTQTTKRLGDPRLGDLLLRDVARALFMRNSDRVSVYVLAQELGLERTQSVLAELVAYQIIEIAKEGDEEYLAFYFSLLRDYLICFRIERWQDLDEAHLLRLLKSLSDSTLHVDLTTFFYRYADESKKRAIDHDLYERAKAYTEFYDGILRQHFPSLRPRFPPYTNGAIGFVGEFYLRTKTIGVYGFRERRQGDEVALLLPYARHERGSNLASFYGATDLHAYSSFREGRIREAILNEEVRRRLQQIVDHGLLDETACPELAAEVIAVEVARDRPTFSDYGTAYSGVPLFPLSVARVRYWLRYALLRHYFDKVLREKKLLSGALKTHEFEDGSFSYEWSPTLEDEDWIREQVEACINESEEKIRQRVKGTLHEGLESLDKRLSTALQSLESAGIDTVAGHPFAADIESWSRFGFRARIEDACAFTERLFNTAFPLVRKVIESSLPTLTGEFATLNRLFTGVVSVKLDWPRHRSTATLYLCEPEPGQEHVRFIARNWKDIETRLAHNPFRFEVCCDGIWRDRWLEALGERHFRLASLVRPHHDYLGSRSSWRSAAGVAPAIRAVVYDWIRVELESAFESLCTAHGVEAKERDWVFFGRPRN